MQDTQAKVHVFKPKYSLPYSPSEPPPTVKVKTSPKEAWLLEADLSRGPWLKIWFEHNGYQIKLGLQSFAKSYSCQEALEA